MTARAPVAPTHRSHYAGIVSRVGSTVVDIAVFSVLSAGSLFLLQAGDALIRTVPFGDVTIAPQLATAVITVLSLAYFAGSWAITGRTVGDAVFGLLVVRPDGSRVRFVRALLRWFVTFFSLALCGIGIAWVLVDRRRRSWHDLVAGTVVVYRSPVLDDTEVDAAGAPAGGAAVRGST